MNKAIVEKTAVCCPNRRDEERVIELRKKFGTNSYMTYRKHHTGKTDFTINVSTESLDYSTTRFYLNAGFKLISVSEYEQILGKPPKKPVLEMPIKPLEHVLASQWVLQHKMYSMRLRCNGTKCTSTWDGNGRRSNIRGLAVAAMKALEMIHEDIERMLKECNDTWKSKDLS